MCGGITVICVLVMKINNFFGYLNLFDGTCCDGHIISLVVPGVMRAEMTMCGLSSSVML